MSSTAPQSAQDLPFHFRCGYKADGRPETWQNYERFCFFLTLDAGRTLTAVARHFQMSKAAISKLAARFNWLPRAKAWDRLGLNAPRVQDLLISQADVARRRWGEVPPSNATANQPQATVQVIRAELVPAGESGERRSPLDVEAFRQASARLGQHHMSASLEMVDSARLMQARLHTMLRQWVKATEDMELDAAVNASQGLAELAMKLSRTIASLATSSAQLATAGSDRWGAALGIDTIMGQLQQFLMQQEAEKAAAAGSTLPVGQEVSP